jgi:hypothetical protein
VALIKGVTVSFISCASSALITWERTASRRRPAFSSHLIATLCAGFSIEILDCGQSKLSCSTCLPREIERRCWYSGPAPSPSIFRQANIARSCPCRLRNA